MTRIRERTTHHLARACHTHTDRYRLCNASASRFNCADFRTWQIAPPAAAEGCVVTHRAYPSRELARAARWEGLGGRDG